MYKRSPHILMIDSEEDLKEEYLLDTDYLIQEDELIPIPETEEIEGEYTELQEEIETYGYDFYTTKKLHSLLERSIQTLKSIAA